MSSGGSAKFRREYEAPVRIGDIVHSKDARDLPSNITETQVERPDDVFTNHERGHSCETCNTITFQDYTVAMNSFKTRCQNQQVPARKKKGAICSGEQGILFAKAGSAIVYHCNVSCSKQNCGGGT